MISKSTGSDTGMAGRVCVVTGGGSGIGRSTALALAREGSKVAILDCDAKGAMETEALVVATGGEALAVACDVSDQSNVEAAHARIQGRFGDAQVLVNNASVGHRSALEDLSLADWNRIFSINLTGYFICAQAFGRAMRANGEGAIVNVSSITAEQPSPNGGAYSIAKAAVTSLSHVIAVEWGPYGVRSNSVIPAWVQTPMSQPLYDTPGVLARRTAAIPARRIGQPEDIAQAIVYLASPRASYVNGADLAVDGGLARNMMNMVPRTAS
jgi:NAD(P)-dependent dehydrogenase (short-subunit alcohol dehydrogenase family)